MHRMSQLVRYREYVVNGGRVVEQDERSGRIRAPAVRSAALIVRFVHVHPAIGTRLLQKSLIFVAQNRKSFFNQLERLFEGKREFRSLHNRHVHIVHIEPFHAERFFPVRNVIVNVLAVAVYAVQQIGVHAFGHVLVEHSLLETSGVAPCGSREHVALNRSGVYRGNGAEQLLVALVIGRESLLSDLLIGVLQHLSVRSVRQLYRFAVHPDGARADVHVVYFGKRRLKLRQRRLRHRQQFFFLFA